MNVILWQTTVFPLSVRLNREKNFAALTDHLSDAANEPVLRPTRGNSSTRVCGRASALEE